MPNYLHHFESALDALKGERRYRVFAALERQAGRFPHALWQSATGQRGVMVWCSLNCWH
jgi:5-aminolevulinate synthase